MNGTKKNLRTNRAKGGGDNVPRKKSKADVTLKWDEDIASSDDESQKSADEKDEGDDEEEETAEETRKR
jgi:hypothetical protein